MGEGGIESFGVLTGEHGTGVFDGAGDHGGNVVAEFAAEVVDGKQGGLDVAGVLGGLDKEDVGAAIDQALGLFVVTVAESVEGDAAGDGDGLGGGAHGTGDKAGAAVLGFKFSGGLASDAGREGVDFVDSVFEAEFGEGDGMAAEGIGFDDVGTGLVVLTMDITDPIGACEKEVFRAVFKGGATPVFDGGVKLLEHGAHGAIEDKNSLLEGFLEGLLALLTGPVHLWIILA